jgi:hypothetical protein
MYVHYSTLLHLPPTYSSTVPQSGYRAYDEPLSKICHFNLDKNTPVEHRYLLHHHQLTDYQKIEKLPSSGLSGQQETITTPLTNDGVVPLQQTAEQVSHLPLLRLHPQLAQDM